MPNTTVKKGSVVKFSILGENATVGRNVHIGGEKEYYPENEWGIAVIGKGKKIADNTVIAPNEII